MTENDRERYREGGSGSEGGRGEKEERDSGTDEGMRAVVLKAYTRSELK